MKDKNKIEIRCGNCKHRIFPSVCNHCEDCSDFSPSEDAYQARISELHTILETVQASEQAEAQEVNRLNEDDAEETWNKSHEQFSLSDMELLRDIVDAKLKSVKRDSEYRCSLLRLSIKCIDILRKLKEVED